MKLLKFALSFLWISSWAMFPFSLPAQNVVRESKQQLLSPDGNYCFTFYQRLFGKDNLRMYYTLTYKGKVVINECELGIEIQNGLLESALAIPEDTCTYWCENLKMTGIDRRKEDMTWQTVYGERDSVRDHYNELVLHFKKGEDGTPSKVYYDKRRFYDMDIVIRAYDEGIALKYHFPETTNGLFLHITGERTSFTFPTNTKAYYEKWAQGPYTLLPLKNWPGESERPLLLLLPNGLDVALTEAKMVDFVRGKFKLSDRKASSVQVSLYDNSVDMITPFDTPWRVIMVAEKPVSLINHKDLILNLNDPCKIKDTSFIKPGKAFRVSQLDQISALKAVDFAVSHGIQYIHLDAGWYGPEMKVEASALKSAPNRNLNIPVLSKYAASKGIGVWLYVNQRALSSQLDSILPLYQKWGIKGIKFGFVQVGNQMWTTWLHEAVRKCARYHLMVDIHDEYRPTGYSRTYPNLLTQEGVRGNEEMPDADHNTLLPFTRFLAGPADYTLCYFNHRIKNTHAHQLAMAVVYYSPLQFMFWYDRPDDYKGEAELKFWKDIPTVWDDSKALDGIPGKYIVQARRSGSTWFVGAMTNRESRDIVIKTAEFLKKGVHYRVDVYQDDPRLTTSTKVASSSMRIKAGKAMHFHLQPSGGVALEFNEE
jgi:alpha-glucosidase